MYSVNQVLGLLTHRPIGWVNFPRKSRVSFNYKSTKRFTATGAERRQEYIAEIKTNQGSHLGGVIQ